MSWKFKTLALFLGFNLLPTLAAGETSGAPSATLVDLSKSEIEQTFRSFSAGEIRGTREASLFGNVFEACRQHFTFTIVQKDSGHAGWRVQDNGRAGRDCMRERQGQACTEATCTSLSTFVPRIRAAAEAGLEAGIVTINPDADVNDANRVNFAAMTPPIRFRSGVVAVEAEHQTVEAERRRRCNFLREQIRTCRDTQDELVLARHALQELVSLADECGNIREASIDRVRRELDRKEFSLLERRIRRADIDELDSLVEEVIQFANSHDTDEDEDGSSYATAAANLLRTIAMRYVRHRNVDEDSFADAREVLEEALDLDGLSETNVARIEGYLNDLDVAEASFMCRSGDPFECQPAYENMMGNLAQRVQDACNGWNIDQNACRTAMMQYQNAPRQIQQTIAQRQQMMASGQVLPGSGGTLGPIGGGAQFGNPYGYQSNPFMMQSGLALNGGMSGLTGFSADPTTQLTMGGMGGMTALPRAPQFNLPVASI